MPCVWNDSDSKRARAVAGAPIGIRVYIHVSWSVPRVSWSVPRAGAPIGIRVYIQIHICIYVYVYVCMYIYVCTYILRPT